MSDAEAIRTFEHVGWERAAVGYEAAFATATRQFIPALLDAAGVGAGRSVLDVACGPGFVAAGAAERGAVARGLDFSAAMLGVARARHPGIAFDQGDAEVLPYADGEFDAVVSNFGITTCLSQWWRCGRRIGCYGRAVCWPSPSGPHRPRT